jgi:hypothetical protein
VEKVKVKNKVRASAVALMAMVAISQMPANDVIVENRSAAVELAQYVTVSPYTRRDGTYVQGHIRTRPDGNPYNNFSYGR